MPKRMMEKDQLNHSKDHAFGAFANGCVVVVPIQGSVRRRPSQDQ